MEVSPLTTKRKQQETDANTTEEPLPKRTAVMSKQLTAKANSWHFFKDKKEPFPTSKKIILVAVELSYPENIGGLIRAAGNIGVDKVIFTGSEANFNRKKIRGTATSAGYQKVQWEFCKEKEWPSRIPPGFANVAVETVQMASNLYQATLPDKVVFVVGNESFGITEWSLQHCDESVFIPMPGVIKSLNVTQAATICMFEWWRQQQNEPTL